MPTPTTVPPVYTEEQMKQEVSEIESAKGHQAFPLAGCLGVWVHMDTSSPLHQYFESEEGVMYIFMPEGVILHSPDGTNTFLSYPIEGEIDGNRFKVLSDHEICPDSGSRYEAQHALEVLGEPSSACEFGGVSSGYDLYHGSNYWIIQSTNVSMVIFQEEPTMYMFDSNGKYIANIDLPYEFLTNGIRFSINADGSFSCIDTLFDKR